MARATAKCTCTKCGGYFFKYKDCHNRAEANNFEEWAQDHFKVCPDCYAAEKEAAAEKAESESGLPELAGSEKQISWAKSIRMNLWNAYIKMENQAMEMANDEEAKAYMDDQAKKFRGIFADVKKASDYIDSRNLDVTGFLNKFSK